MPDEQFASPPGGRPQSGFPPGSDQTEDIFDHVDPASQPAFPRRPTPGADRGAPPVNLPSDVPPRVRSALASLVPPPPPAPAPLPTLGAGPKNRGVTAQPGLLVPPLGSGSTTVPPPSVPQPAAPVTLPDLPSFPTDEERAAVAKQPPLFARKNFMIVGVTVLALAGLGGAGWLAYSRLNARPQPGQVPPTTTVAPTPAVTPTGQSNGEGAENVAPPPQPGPAVAEPVPAEVELDADYDGLSDREEQLYGTDAYATDSDGDGLTDRDEVKVFGTDPVAADTDGDGFRDGEEVANGYDPKGAGRIKVVPAE